MKALPEVLLTREFHPRVIAEDLRPYARTRICPRDWARRLGTVDALITQLSDPIGAHVLDRAPKLRVIGNFAVGVNNIDLAECARRGISVVNTPGVLTRSTAELALGLLLACARRLPEGDALCRQGRFQGWRPDLLLGLELRGRRAVLLGQGRIGCETAKLFRAIGLKIEWITRADSEAKIRAKLSRAQVLSLHVPLAADTRHWLDAGRIRRLPPDAIVINTSRGPVIDESALIAALRERRIFAAGLDVYEREPVIPAGLRRLPNAVLLPHIGSATEQTREAMARLVIAGVKAILGGKHPSNLVKNPGNL